MNALVVGGNSGIGLSLTCELLSRNYDTIYVVGKNDLDVSALNEELRKKIDEKVVFFRTNLINDDYSFLENIKNVNTLIITVGFGRVALFNDLSEPEIANLIKVDLLSVIKIIRHFYNEINSNVDFYTAVMVSICGRIVSPFFSIYGAAKGGLRFFIENINCELESLGIANRVLEVSPGSIKGTQFNGGGNDLDLLKELSSDILERMYDRETLFIPLYEEVYKSVIERYQYNPIAFGRDSYKYKATSGRISNKPQVIIGYLSGTFDLFHIGHLNLLKRAKAECDYLIVSVHNSGAWKGKESFIPYDERRAIVESIKYVDEVVDDYAEDADAWDIYHYNKLFVGSDYKGTERFNRYEKILKGKAEIVYFPYTKGTSSTQLRDALKRK